MTVRNPKGAGRPKKFSEKTRAVRLPESIATMLCENVECCSNIKLLNESIQQHDESNLHTLHLVDVLNILQKTPADWSASFFCPVPSNAMEGAHIQINDIALLDTKARPKHGDIVIGRTMSTIFIKRYVKNSSGIVVLKPESARDYSMIKKDFKIWGIVRLTIKIQPT